MRTILIVGLGNPGRKYENTRHNVGFLVSDTLAEKYSASFIEEARFQTLAAAFDVDDLRVILAKPQTFMNESGQTVGKIVKFYKLDIADLFIVHDEIDLPFGKMKLYGPGGSSAGHKGIDSIIKAVGDGFTRLRVGIENRKEFRVPETDAYVLQKFTDEEKKILQKKIIPAAIAEIESKFIQRS